MAAEVGAEAVSLAALVAHVPGEGAVLVTVRGKAVRGLKGVATNLDRD